MVEERRQVYRVTPEAKDMLGVTIRGEGGPVDAEILDVSIDGVGLTIPPDTPLLLQIDQNAHLVFRSPKLKKPLELQAIVRSRRELDQGVRYGLRFEPSDQLKTLLESELFRLFNQRGAYRVELDASEPVKAELKVLHVDSGEAVSGTTINAKLRDVSATGAGALVDHAANVMLSDAGLVQVAFNLPGVSEPLRLLAWIRNRRPVDDRICLGLEFDADRSTGFIKQQDEITDFIMRRQRTALATRVR